MSDLTDFLTERLDDDEAWAKAGFDAEWPEFNEPGTPGHHARVLADIKAKRRLVALAEEAGSYQGYVDSNWPGGSGDPDIEEAILRHLAAVYADHPDYRPEWRP